MELSAKIVNSSKRRCQNDVGGFVFCDEAVSLFRQSATLGLGSSSPKAADDKKAPAPTKVSAKKDRVDFGAVPEQNEPIKELVVENVYEAVLLFKQSATLGTKLESSKESEKTNPVKKNEDKEDKDIEHEGECDYEAVPLRKQRATLGRYAAQNGYRTPSKIGKILQSGKIRHSFASGWVYDVDYLNESKDRMDHRHRSAEYLMRLSLSFFAKLDRLNGGKPKPKPKPFSKFQYKNGIQCAQPHFFN